MIAAYDGKNLWVTEKNWPQIYWPQIYKIKFWKIFKDLRDAVKLYNFSSGYLLKEGMMSTDIAYEIYTAEERRSKAIARKLLAMGDSVEKICAATGLYKKQVLKLLEENTEES